MRVLIELDDDVLDGVRRLQAEQGSSFSAALNELVRRGLAGPHRRFVQQTTSGEVLVDLRCTGEVLAMLDEVDHTKTGDSL